MTTKKIKKPATPKPTQALVIKQISLTKQQRALSQATTPPEFIKIRKARGGKTVRYVEGGYVVARLNQIFGALNWNWEILEHGKLDRKIDSKAEGEVWVRGRLAIIDHINGYKIAKDAFGQHPIHPEVPYGDALKSASTDAMKKAAAQGVGIALDVYWQQLDSEKLNSDTKVRPAPITGADKKEQRKTLLQLSKDKITQETDTQILMEWRQKIMESKTFTNQEKVELGSLINTKINAKPKIQGNLIT